MYYMDKNPDSLAYYYKKGIDYLIKNKIPKRFAAIYNNWANAEAEYGNYDLALRLCDSAIKYYQQYNNTARVGVMIMTRANVYLSKGEYEQASKEYFKAMKSIDEKSNAPVLCQIYNNLVILFNDTKKYQQALQYCNKELKLAKVLNLTDEIGWACVNYFETYRYMDSLEGAKQYVEQLYSISKQTEDLSLKAAAADEMGTLKLFEKKYTEAISFYNQAMINEQLTDRMMLCSTLNSLASAYQKLNQPQKAEIYLKQALDLSFEIQDREERKDTYELLAENSRLKKEFESAFNYSILYNNLSDSLLNEKSQQEIIDVNAKYQSEQKQNEIETQTLKLNEQNAAINKQTLIRNFLILISLLVVLISVLFFNRDRQQQTRIKLEERERISHDLHDNVGSSLGSIANFCELIRMKSIEFSPDEEQNLLAKIETTSRETIENMSDIVWAINPKNDTLDDVITRMENFAADLLTPKNISYDFDIEKNIGGHKLQTKKRKNIYLIFKEAIFNAEKYAECKKINIRIFSIGNKLNMKIQDDGNGFDVSNIKSRNGNGIENMKTRAKEINGRLEISSAINQGTNIDLSFPFD